MDKFDYIDSITTKLKSLTALNFQMSVGDVLRIYYENNGNVYEMPAPYGGDDKNDGWVKDKALFYQIYAPTVNKNIKSSRKDIRDKFQKDLHGLLSKIYNEGKWNNTINDFIFLVNTFDGKLPHNSDDFYQKKVNEFRKEFNITFDYEVTNIDYIEDLLNEINDIDVLERISAKINARKMIDFNAVTEGAIIKLIDQISSNINHAFKNNISKKDYERISGTEKIFKNNLINRKKTIENGISKLDVVDKAVQVINQDLLFEEKFERVKKYIVLTYKELSEDYEGIALYDKLVLRVAKYSNYISDDYPAELLIIYIFDKCDIFKK